MRVLIVSKTRMYEHACVGAIAVDGTSLRLLTETGGYQSMNTPFEIGTVWEIDYRRPPSEYVDPPHFEDVYVLSQTFEKHHPHALRETLLNRLRLVPWTGPVSALYGGLLQFSPRGSGYIGGEVDAPDRSTWFWILDRTMYIDGKYYRYQHDPKRFKIRYVGFEDPCPTLAPGTLVRVSLSRWFNRYNVTPGFYLQFSGWYD